MSEDPRPRATAVRIHEEVAPKVRVGLVDAEPVAVGPADSVLLHEMENLAGALRELHEGRTPSEIDALGAARELYRSFAIDPTKTRPSSEALLRRVLKGKALPRIINAVDVCNLLSLRFLLPIGLYDVAKIHGDVVLRRGRTAESYAGIRKDEVRLEGRPVLGDEQGPFGNPTSDSQRTSVDASTTALCMVIFGPASVPEPAMGENVRVARETIARHLAAPGTPVLTTGSVL